MWLQRTRVLAAGLGLAGLWACATGSSTSPDPPPAAAPPPPPIVIREGAMGLLAAGWPQGASFRTTTAGTFQLGMDWTPTGNETTITARLLRRSFEGACAPGCEREDLCPSHCRTSIDSWIDVSTRPAVLRTGAAIPPDNYELHIYYYDPLDYLIPMPRSGPTVRVTLSYQIMLFPVASTSSTPVP